MNKTLLATALLLSSQAFASAYYANVTNEWFLGRQTNVLALANQRLASNPNDMAGLLMKASYDFDFADANTLSNSLVRVLSVGETISTPSFTNAYRLVRLDIRGTFKTLSSETPEEHASDMLKIMGAGHQMAYEDALKALDDDGYFDN